MTLQREIDALYARYPDVLYGFADIAYSDFARNYRSALIMAVPYGKQLARRHRARRDHRLSEVQ